jgi:AcrR family transcriptional regulator
MPEKALISKGEQTRMAIIEAAYAVFLEKGYHGASMRQIADRAQIALGGIYNHFTGKEDIFAAVLDAYHPYRRIVPVLEKAEGETVDAFLHDAARQLKNEIMGAEHKLLPLAFIEVVEFQGRHLARLAEKIMPSMLRFVQRFGERRGKLRPFPAPVMLRMLFALFVGYSITGVMLKNIPTIQDSEPDALDGMVDIYLHGIMDPEG